MGTPFMARLCTMAQSFLLVGAICCGPLSVAARSPELSRGSEALGGEVLGDQLTGVASATNQKNRDLSRLALLTSRGRDHDESVVSPSEPFGGKLLIAPVSDLSAK